MPPSLVPGRPPRHLRRPFAVGTAARFLTTWARGATSLAARYPLEAVPPWQREDQDDDDYDGLPDHTRSLPGDPDTVGHLDIGVGPLFHRRYRLDQRGTTTTPERLVALLVADVNSAAPNEIGRFEHADGRAIGPLRVGEECLVNLPGPGNAPIRVIDIAPTEVTFVTLTGHIEAGEITFRATTHDEALRFEIESWARSSATVLHLLYDVVPIAREMQLVMWTRMCRNVVGLAGGEAVGDVQVMTRRLAWPPQGEA